MPEITPTCTLCNPLGKDVRGLCEAHRAKAEDRAQRHNLSLTDSIDQMFEVARQEALDAEESEFDTEVEDEESEEEEPATHRQRDAKDLCVALRLIKLHITEAPTQQNRDLHNAIQLIVDVGRRTEILEES